MVGKPDVAGILMPTELHPGLGAFDHVLFPEQVGVLPKGGLADFRHEVAEEEFEMRSAFGEDTKVVNILTGKETHL